MHPAGVHQQTGGIQSQRLAFQQRLGVVVVVLDLEHVQHVLVGSQTAHLLEQVLSGLGQHLVHRVQGHRSHLRVTALHKDLGRVLHS